MGWSPRQAKGHGPGWSHQTVSLWNLSGGPNSSAVGTKPPTPLGRLSPGPTGRLLDTTGCYLGPTGQSLGLAVLPLPPSCPLRPTGCIPRHSYSSSLRSLVSCQLTVFCKGVFGLLLKPSHTAGHRVFSDWVSVQMSRSLISLPSDLSPPAVAPSWLHTACCPEAARQEPGHGQAFPTLRSRRCCRDILSSQSFNPKRQTHLSYCSPLTTSPTWPWCLLLLAQQVLSGM